MQNLDDSFQRKAPSELYRALWKQYENFMNVLRVHESLLQAKSRNLVLVVVWETEDESRMERFLRLDGRIVRPSHKIHGN